MHFKISAIFRLIDNISVRASAYFHGSKQHQHWLMTISTPNHIVVFRSRNDRDDGDYQIVVKPVLVISSSLVTMASAE